MFEETEAVLWIDCILVPYKYINFISYIIKNFIYIKFLGDSFNFLGSNFESSFKINNFISDRILF